MAREPDEQREADAGRIPERGSGKLDQRGGASQPEATHVESAEAPGGETPALDPAAAAALRERIEREREDAIGRLRALGLMPGTDDTAPRAGSNTVLDEGDEAQASERQDMGLITRQRLAQRINRLTAALERLQQGRYGVCTNCGRPIEPGRLAAAPESDTCLACQERREQQAAA